MKIQSLLSSTGAKRAASIVTIFAAFAVITSLVPTKHIAMGELTAVYHQSQWNAYAPEVERAARALVPSRVADLCHAYGGVVSHHVPMTIPKLVEFYSHLKETQLVNNFIVIGPDHNDAGKGAVTVSNTNFYTKFGEVEPIEGLAKKLQDAGLATIDESPFDPEHSVGSQILVISKIFPGAHVTPLIFRSNAPIEQARALGKMLATFLDEKSVLIASVDFSHYLPTGQAESIDQVSGQVIRHLDADALALVKADSSEAMETFMTAMREKRAYDTGEFQVLNTNDLMQNSDYTTGYVFGFWGVKSSAHCKGE